MGVRFRLLGSLAVTGDDGPVDVGSAKARSLLSILLLHAGRVVPTDLLVDALWDGAPPPSAVVTLQGYVSGLRRALEPDQRGRTGRLLVTRAPGYLLDIDPEALDIVRFERRVAAARRALDAADATTAAEGFSAALALWQGPALADVSDLVYARAEAARLEEARLDALEGWAAATLDLGRAAEVLGPLEGALASAPLRESLRHLLMLALYRAGRQADALRTYQELRRELIEELGIEPTRELAALERSILDQDPRLDHVASDGSSVGEVEVRATVSTSPGFVGRLPELAALSDDLAAALAGHGRVTSLAGEPGIGKTRLAEEVATRAADAGALVVWGRCYEGKGAPAFWPWSQALDCLLAAVPAEVAVEALGTDAAELAQLVPAVHELAGPLDPPPGGDPDATRFRAYAAVGAFLRRLATVRPVVLVLDDLHWADAASLQLLSYIAGHVTSTRTFVVTTHRNIDPIVGEALSDTMAELARQPSARRLDVVGLARDEVDVLVRATPAAAAADADVVASLHERTHGNPFFLTELLQLLDTDGRSVPTGVRDVIRRRAGALSEPTIDILRGAAVLGQRFELRVLAAVADLDVEAVLDRLDDALAAGLVVPTPEVPGGYRFSHGLVSETLADELPSTARARWHRRVAEALGAHHGAEPGPHLVVVATHWTRALPLAEPEVVIDHILRAARWSQQQLAFEQAEDQVRQALPILGQLPVATSRSALELRMQDQLSQLLTIIEGYASPGVAAACDRMRVLCDEVDDPELLLASLWRLSLYYCVRTDLDTAVELGHQMLALVHGADSPGLALAGHMALGAAHNHRGELREGRAHLDAALALCEAGHALAVEGAVLETAWVWTRVFLAWNLWLTGDPDQADKLVVLAMDEARRVDPGGYGTGFTIWFGALIAGLREDVDAVLERCEAGMAVATGSGFGMFIPFFLAYEGWAVGWTGDVAAGIARIEAAHSGVKASGARMLLHVFPALAAQVHLHAGHADDALRSADHGLAEVEATTERWFEAELLRIRGEALAALGDLAGAEEAMRAGIEVATAQGARTLQERTEASLDALLERSPSR